MTRGILERRLRRATIALAVLLVATFAVLLPQVAFKTEDAVFQRQTAHMLANLRVDPAAALAPGMRMLSSADPIPSELRERIDGLPPGVHELNDVCVDGTLTETDLFVGIEIVGIDRRVLVYDVRPFEAFDEAIAAPAYDAVILAGLALAALGAMAVWRQLHRVFSSLRSLAPLLRTEVATADRSLAVNFCDDEIGSLARELVASRTQLASALDRERRFTREASHELRTPVAIIAGAVELLRRDAALSLVADGLVERIDVANKRIEALIGAFLWLAREPVRAEELQTLTLMPLLERVLTDLRRAGSDASEVSLIVAEDRPFDGEPLCAEVVLRNLIDNALRYRGDGPVEIHVDGAVRIVNSLPAGDLTSSGSHGLGLGIARDICTRFGWQFSAAMQDGRHVASVRFDVPRG